MDFTDGQDAAEHLDINYTGKCPNLGIDDSNDQALVLSLGKNFIYHFSRWRNNIC